MNFGTDAGISKRKKVFFDEYTNGFYTESKMETLQRKCEYRSKGADVLNRSEESRLNIALKSVKAARNLFTMKTEREQTFHQEKLRDHLAYKHVLENISKQRDKMTDWDDTYGKYGFGINKTELDSEIQHQRQEMTPMVIRKRQAEQLLSNRKKVDVFDRNMKTPELLGLIKNKRTKSSSPVHRRKSPARKKTPKLILPPITVTWNRDKSSRRNENSVNVDNLESKPTPVNKSAEDKGLPAVFVTQVDPS